MVEFNGHYINAAHIEWVGLGDVRPNMVVASFPGSDNYLSHSFDTPEEAKAELDRLVKAIDAETMPGLRDLRRGRQ